MNQPDTQKEKPPSIVGDLVKWGVTSVAFWIPLIVVVPNFAKAFRSLAGDKSFHLPVATSVLLAASAFVRTPLGLGIAALVTALPVALYLGGKNRRGLSQGFRIARWAVLAWVAFLVIALFLPLTNMIKALS